MGDQADKLRSLMEAMNKKKNYDKSARIVTVTSGKGGVGKTSFVVNFAIALANCGKKVVILDADFGFSNVNILLGTTVQYDLGHVIRGEKRLNEVMEDTFDGVKYISGGAGVSELLNLDVGHLDYVLEQMTELEDQADIILIDTGAGLQKSTLRLIDASDETVLVVTPEPTSITDAYVVLKTVAACDERPQVSLVINKVRTEQVAMVTSRNLSNVAMKFLSYKIGMLGYINNDYVMINSIAALVPHIIKHPMSISSRQIQAMASQYVDASPETETKRGVRQFLQRFMRKG